MVSIRNGFMVSNYEPSQIIPPIIVGTSRITARGPEKQITQQFSYRNSFHKGNHTADLTKWKEKWLAYPSPLRLAYRANDILRILI